MKFVYLHGFASGPESSKARFLAGRFREQGLEMAVPDLAAGDFEHLTISGQLEVVGREVGGGPAVLIGSSMGGYVAALYAARHAEIQKLVLLAPAFGFARRWPEALGEVEVEAWRRTGYREVYHYAEGRVARIGYELIADGQHYEDYPDVRQSVLIIHGRQDAVVPPAYSEKFAQSRANVHLILVDSDHQLLDAFDQIWNEVREFLGLTDG